MKLSLNKQYPLTAIILTLLLFLLFGIPEFYKLVDAPIKNDTSAFIAKVYTFIHGGLILVFVWLGIKESK